MGWINSLDLEDIARILVAVLVVAPAIVFTVETSEGNPILIKLAKFAGLVVSALPLIGYLLYRLGDRESGYSGRCGVMALLGVFLMLLAGAM